MLVGPATPNGEYRITMAAAGTTRSITLKKEEITVIIGLLGGGFGKFCESEMTKY